MSQNRSYPPPTPNYPGDNNNSSNTNDSHNNNDSLLNNSNKSFNRNNNGYFYENPVFVIVNNTSNEIDVRSAVEIARRIPETLPLPFPLVPSNPDSILREATIFKRFQNQGSRRSTLPLRDNPEKEITIAVMGPIGAGKSYFIKEVSGISEIKVSASFYSCTSKVQSYSFPYGPAKITLVDTPTFNNTWMRDYDVLAELSAWTSAYRQGRLLSGISYPHDIKLGLWSARGLPSVHFGMLQKLCSPSALQNVLLTNTQWPKVDPEAGGSREKTLRDHSHWRELVAKGAAIERFMGTSESGLELIDKLMKKEPKPLLIQPQMVNEGKVLEETDAGK